jgi:hypothetical protein
MKKITIYFLTGLLLCSLVSCEKFLAKKSDSSLVTPSTLSDFEGLLDDADLMNSFSTPGYMEASADDYFLLPQTYQNLNQIFINLYTWQHVENNFVNDWSKSYLAIYNANLCLEGLNGLDGKDDLVKFERVKGAALFFRAYYFTGLLWNYAKAYDEQNSATDLGIALRLSADFNSPTVRNNVQSCYQQAIMDVRTSIRMLPNQSMHPFRPSRAAAYGLLSRIYLSMRRYDQAYLYADSCLKLNHDLMDYNNPNDLNISLGNDVPFKQFNKETIFYTEMNNSVSIIATSRAKIDTLLYRTYDDADLRKVAFFKPNSGYQQFKGSYAGSPFNFFSGIAVDEMLLTRAECLARAGKVSEAMDDLNFLLKKRWKNSVTYPKRTAISKENALQQILEERRKELLMRGLRWMDIKRLNKEGANIVLKRIVSGKTFTLLPNDSFYALPLPDDLVRITGIIQN